MKIEHILINVNSEIILWDVYIQIASTIIASIITLYCFNLSRLFRGGLFYNTFKWLSLAFTLYAIGSLFDIFAESGIDPNTFHMIHLIGYMAFFAIVVYSIREFYKVWSRMGIKDVE